jgi:hypothetical protein
LYSCQYTTSYHQCSLSYFDDFEEGAGGSGGGGNPPVLPPLPPCPGTAFYRAIENGGGNAPVCNPYFWPWTGNFQGYMNSINAWASLAALNNSLGYYPYSTYFLRSHGRNRGWDQGVSPITFSRRCGKAFENSALEFFKLPANCFPEATPDRGDRNTSNGGLPNKVVPDAHTAAIYVKEETGGLQPTYIPLGGYICTEVKAVDGPIRLSSNRWQVLGELEVLSQAKAELNNPLVPSNVRPVLFFITTSNTIIDQSIIDEANSRGIMVWQSKATYDPANCCKLSFTVPVMLNFTALPGVDIAPLSYLGIAGIFSDPQVLLEPTPECDQDDPETIE